MVNNFKIILDKFLGYKNTKHKKMYCNKIKIRQEYKFVVKSTIALTF